MKRFIVYTLILALLSTATTLLWALRPPKQLICRDGKIIKKYDNREMQRITIRKKWARARGKDVDGPVNAEAQVDCEKDEWREFQSRGIQYKAWAKIKGDAPADYPVYGGRYSVSAEAMMDSKTDKHWIKWTGEIDDREDASYKVGGSPPDDYRYFDGLSNTWAVGFIGGGSPGANTFANQVTASAGQFPYNQTYDWDCGKCWGYRKVFDEDSRTMVSCP